MKWFLKEISKNNYALDLNIKQVDELSRSINRSFYSLGMALLASIFILCGSLFIKDLQVLSAHDVPILTWIFWGFAAYLIVRIATLKRY